MLFLSLSNQGFAIFLDGHHRCAHWSHSGCSFTEMFAFIKRNKSDAKFLTFMINFLTFMGKAGGHFIHTVRHIHVLDHGPFTDIVSALAI
jgi:hypothetical protein